MTATIDPVELEHRLTKIEIGQEAGFSQLRQTFNQQASNLRQSIDTLTCEVGKQNKRVDDLENWRHEQVTTTKVNAAAQTARSKLTHQIWNVGSEVAKLAAALGLVTFLIRLLGG